MRNVIATGERIGRYRVYTDGARYWYYVGRPGAPEWYVYTDPNADGAYVDRNPYYGRCR